MASRPGDYAKYQEQQALYRSTHRDHYAKYHREKRATNSQWLAEQKTRACMDCGGAFPKECMDFDHVRGEKLFNIGEESNRNRESLINEISKCDLVCANCHRIRTFARQRGETALHQIPISAGRAESSTHGD